MQGTYALINTTNNKTIEGSITFADCIEPNSSNLRSDYSDCPNRLCAFKDLEFNIERPTHVNFTYLPVINQRIVNDTKWNKQCIEEYNKKLAQSVQSEDPPTKKKEPIETMGNPTNTILLNFLMVILGVISMALIKVDVGKIYGGIGIFIGIVLPLIIYTRFKVIQQILP